MEDRKYQTPRGAAATAAKNTYRNGNYDRTELALPKGMKARLEEISKEQGLSKNAYVIEAIKEKYMHDTGKNLEWTNTAEREAGAKKPGRKKKEL
jgi:predicted DNA-binding protein